jgi:hypothetical protein
MAGGRPTKYKEEYCDNMYKHFDVPTMIPEMVREYNDEDKKWNTVEGAKMVANKLPTVVSFCRKIRINRDTFYEWVEKYDEFSDTYKNCKTIMEDIWIENSLYERYSKSFTIFLGKNVFGWKDKQEIEIELEPMMVKVVNDARPSN